MKSLLATSIILIWCFTACRKADQPPVEQAESPQVSKDTSIPVQIEVVRKDELAAAMNYAQGKVQSPHRVDLSFRISGYINEIHVENGQTVKAGQLLMTLDGNQQRLNLEESQVAYENAMSAYENEIAGYGDSTAYDNWARIKEKVALAQGLRSAEVALKRARFEMKLTQLRSPIDGVISGLTIRAGNQISSGQTLLSVYKNQPMNVVAQITEFDASQVKIGDKAQVLPVAQQDRQIAGRVFEIDPAVNNQGLVRVRLRLEKAAGLYPGMNVEVRLLSGAVPTLKVPKQAIVKRPDGRKVVFTYQNGLAKWNYVEIEDEEEQHASVTSGIQEGDSVIVSSVFQLAHDSKVTLSD